MLVASSIVTEIALALDIGFAVIGTGNSKAPDTTTIAAAKSAVVLDMQAPFRFGNWGEARDDRRTLSLQRRPIDVS
jgi:hypothetical protein